MQQRRRKSAASARQHGDADSLSRFPLPDNASSDIHDEDRVTFTPISITSVADDQTRDPYVEMTIRFNDGTSQTSHCSLRRNAQLFRMHDGFLYRRNYSPVSNATYFELSVLRPPADGYVLRALHLAKQPFLDDENPRLQ